MRIETLLSPETVGYSGPTTGYVVCADLTTAADYRKFDVAIAGMFRVAEWRVTGSYSLAPNSDAINLTFTRASLGDESNLVLDEDTTHTTNIITPGGAAGGPILTFVFGPIGFIANGNEGFISVRIDGTGATVAGSFSTDLFGSTDVIGTLTVRVPAWRGGGFHSFTRPIFGTDPSTTCNLLMEGTLFLEYRDADGLNPVWDSASGAALLDPVDAEVP
jgi:hypothetical protein